MYVRSLEDEAMSNGTVIANDRQPRELCANGLPEQSCPPRETLTIYVSHKTAVKWGEMTYLSQRQVVLHVSLRLP